MNISCFLAVWFPIWLRPDRGDIALTHSLRSPASISANQISLVGLFIIASSDCEWCLANGFSIQICWLDATESQQGLSFLQLQSGVNKRKITCWNLHLCHVIFKHLVRVILILQVLRWSGYRKVKERKKKERKKESWSSAIKPIKTCSLICVSIHPEILHSFLTVCFFPWQTEQKGIMTHQMRVRKWTNNCNKTKQKKKYRGTPLRWKSFARKWAYVVLTDSYGYDNNYKP